MSVIQRRGTGLIAALITVAALAAASPAIAAEGDAVFQSCISETGSGGACVDGSNLSDAFAVAVSPDGRHAYASAQAADTVHAFKREANGDLTTIGCIKNGGGSGCADGRGLDGPRGIAISGDGRFVYVGTEFSSGVAVLNRDTTTGQLTQRADAGGCITESGLGTCRNGRSLNGVVGLAFAPDGKNIYVSGSGPRLAALDVEADGSLTQKPEATGCISNDGFDSDGNIGGCVQGRNIGSSYLMDVSPDNLNVYATNSTAGGLLVFNRNTSTGGLTQKTGTAGCFSVADPPPANCQTDTLLATPWTVQVTADGTGAIVVAAASVLVYSRAADGTLTRIQCFKSAAASGCGAAGGLSANINFSSAISSDSKDVVVNNYAGNGGLVFFRRNTTNGLLTRHSGTAGCITQDGSGGVCQTAAMLGNSGLPTFGPGGTQIYSGFRDGNSVVTFKRDVAPVCVDTSVTTAFQTAIQIELPCTDPNGDPISSWQITEQPQSGQLGAIDQPTGKVSYNPFGGFSGGDSFKFRAFAAGVAAPPATANVTTGAAPPPPPPVIGGIDGDGDGFTNLQECNDSDPKINPKAQEIPGNTIDEDCDGIAAPFAKVASGVSTQGLALSIGTRFTKFAISQVPSGGTVEMRCSAKKKKACPFKRKKLKVSGGKANGLTAVSKKKRKKAKGLLIRVGATLEVRITAPSMVGKVVRYKIKKRKYPTAQTLCLQPGATKPAACT